MPVSLSLPLREDRYIGAPVSAVFDNLLPDNPEFEKKSQSGWARKASMRSAFSQHSAAIASAP